MKAWDAMTVDQHAAWIRANIQGSAGKEAAWLAQIAAAR